MFSSFRCYHICYYLGSGRIPVASRKCATSGKGSGAGRRGWRWNHVTAQLKEWPNSERFHRTKAEGISFTLCKIDHRKWDTKVWGAWTTTGNWGNAGHNFFFLDIYHQKYFGISRINIAKKKLTNFASYKGKISFWNTRLYFVIHFRELEQNAKNCRILQFKLRKSDRQREQLQSEKNHIASKLLEFQANGTSTKSGKYNA